MTREALLNLLEREGTAKTLVCSPSLGRWTRVRDCDEVSLALAEREEAASRPAGAVPLNVLPPPPGEPWFYPVSSVAVALLNLLTLGFYAFVWRYQHRVWALRRAGLPTSPIGAVFRGEFRLDLELARASRETGVYFPLGFDPRSTVRQQGVFLALLILVPPILLLMVIVVIISDTIQQETANRVNRAVAPRLPARLVGWPEIGTVLAVPFGFFGALVGLVAWLLVS